MPRTISQISNDLSDISSNAEDLCGDGRISQDLLDKLAAATKVVEAALYECEKDIEYPCEVCDEVDCICADDDDDKDDRIEEPL